jgi:hypothetical protein
MKSNRRTWRDYTLRHTHHDAHRYDTVSVHMTLMPHVRDLLRGEEER